MNQKSLFVVLEDQQKWINQRSSYIYTTQRSNSFFCLQNANNILYFNVHNKYVTIWYDIPIGKVGHIMYTWYYYEHAACTGGVCAHVSCWLLLLTFNIFIAREFWRCNIWSDYIILLWILLCMTHCWDIDSGCYWGKQFKNHHKDRFNKLV